jgi:hypothetical protein
VEMGRYAVQMNRTASATLPVGSVTADATRPRRIKWYDFLWGSEATPADGAFLVAIQRVTAAGTSTGVTPHAIDPGDAATEADAGENHTIDATATAGAICLAWSVNQRASLRWVAPPGGEIVTPATASNGAAVYTPTAALVAVTATVYFEEQ